MTNDRPIDYESPLYDPRRQAALFDPRNWAAFDEIAQTQQDHYFSTPVVLIPPTGLPSRDAVVTRAKFFEGPLMVVRTDTRKEDDGKRERHPA